MTNAADLLLRLRQSDTPIDQKNTPASGLDLLRALRASPAPAPGFENKIVPTTALGALLTLSGSGAMADVRTEAERIRAIPTWFVSEFEGLDLTEDFRVPGGTWTLHPIQSLALHWIRETGGLLGPLAVGCGKTLLSLLAAEACGAKRPLLFLPPQMQIPLRREMGKYKKHFRMPKNLTILPYSVLSQASSTTLLGGQEAGSLFPDLIIADECFPYETKVLTDVGAVSIGDIVERGVGTFALSYNTSQEKAEWQPIVRRMRKSSDSRLVRVLYAGGSVCCTEEHKIWTENRGYVRAIQLESSDTLCALSEKERGPRSAGVVRVEVLERKNPGGHRDGSRGSTRVYDLEIAGNHNYVADRVVVSNCHNLRHVESARTKRVGRYMDRYPETKFVAISGTLTSRGLSDYAHLSEWCLKGNSPVPREAMEKIAWGNCLDSKADPRPQDWNLFSEFHDVRKYPEEVRVKKARAAFQERFLTTPGVVATQEGSVESSLMLRLRPIDIPREVREALRDLNTTWCRPDGEELATALDRWRVATQLVQGFYYYWDWPDGIVDLEWMGARAFWHKEVRRITQMNIEGLDSKLLVRNAVLNGTISDPTVYAAWAGWEKVRDRPQPPTKTQWIDNYFIADAVQWLRENPRGLLWYSDKCVRDKLAEYGVETYAAGEDVPEDGRGMALSIDSHGTGLNLQANSSNLIISFPSSGKTCEQLLGRTHRYGQAEDEVTFDYYAPNEDTQKCVETARRDARYIQETQKSPQKLCYATWTTAR